MFVYIYIVVRDPFMKKGRVEIPLTLLTQPHFLPVLSQGRRTKNLNAIVFDLKHHCGMKIFKSVSKYDPVFYWVQVLDDQHLTYAMVSDAIQAHVSL